MSKFIKLTWIDDTSIYVNIDNIGQIEPNSNNPKLTNIWYLNPIKLTHDSVVCGNSVKESPYEIINEIENVQNGKRYGTN